MKKEKIEKIGKEENILTMILDVKKKYLFTSGKNFLIKKWNLENKKEIFIGNSKTENFKLFFGIDNLLFSWGLDCSLKKWIVNYDEEIEIYQNDFFNNFFIFKNFLFISGEKVLKIDLLTKKEIVLYDGNSEEIIFDDFENKLFFRNKKEIYQIFLNNKKIEKLYKCKNEIKKMILSKKKKIIIISDKKGNLILYNHIIKKKIKKLQNIKVSTLKISKNEKYLYFGEKFENSIKRINLKNFEISKISNHNLGVNELVISKNSKYLFSTGQDKKIKLHNIKTGEFKIYGICNKNWILKMQIDDKYLYTYFSDNILKKWNLITKKLQVINKNCPSLNSLFLTEKSKFLVFNKFNKIYKVSTNYLLQKKLFFKKIKFLIKENNFKDLVFLEMLKTENEEMLYSLKFQKFNIFYICSAFNFQKSLLYSIKHLDFIYPLNFNNFENLISPIETAIINKNFNIVNIIIKKFCKKKNFSFFLTKNEFLLVIQNHQFLKDSIPFFFNKIEYYGEFKKKDIEANHKFFYYYKIKYIKNYFLTKSKYFEIINSFKNEKNIKKDKKKIDNFQIQEKKPLLENFEKEKKAKKKIY